MFALFVKAGYIERVRVITAHLNNEYYLLLFSLQKVYQIIIVVAI